MNNKPLAVAPKSAAPCPLCGSKNTSAYTGDKFRQYLICSECLLVFVPKQYHVSDALEKERYDRHNNHPKDKGYRKFLSRLFDPLRAKLSAGAVGLDFGCGPGPALAAMFSEAGFRMDLYDKFYADNPFVFSKKYDFITATEVLEHLKQPGIELSRLHGLLKPSGILGIMTKLVIDRPAFDKWHYKNDLTHICFFSRPTFEWLANAWQARIEFVWDDVILIYI